MVWTFDFVWTHCQEWPCTFMADEKCSQSTQQKNSVIWRQKLVFLCDWRTRMGALGYFCQFILNMNTWKWDTGNVLNIGIVFPCLLFGFLKKLRYGLKNTFREENVHSYFTLYPMWGQKGFQSFVTLSFIKLSSCRFCSSVYIIKLILVIAELESTKKHVSGSVCKSLF